MHSRGRRQGRRSGAFPSMSRSSGFAQPCCWANELCAFPGHSWPQAGLGSREGLVVSPLAEEGRGFSYLERSREQEALTAVAALALQQAQLVCLLDTLRKRLDRECLAELHEGADDR